METTNQHLLATPPTTPTATKGPDKAEVLTNVLSLATLFSTCVEAFSLIHPSKDGDRNQKIALARLGLQQGRLLIFGDAVGICAPPATIARHMIPSHPGATNPDPHLPVNFGVRDPRLDEPAINQKVRAALDEIAGRPSHLSRDELMERFGLKTPKRFGITGYPALDTNRLEAFREKYALLLDLVRQMGIRTGFKRGMSMIAQQWTVQNVSKFEAFVKTVRIEVDGLIALLGVKEQVDRGMKTDIHAMGWHPDLSGPIVRHDWEKLKLICEACALDYPEYVDAADTALKYISEELKGTSLAHMRAARYTEMPPKRQPEAEPNEKHSNGAGIDKEKRPGFLSHFKLKSWNKSREKVARASSKSITDPSQQGPPRSMSESAGSPSDEFSSLMTVRSKSLSHVPDEPAPFDLDARLDSVPTHDESTDPQGIPVRTSNDANRLTHADTKNSLVDRHDMFKGMGRIETKDIRAKAHDWA